MILLMYSMNKKKCGCNIIFGISIFVLFFVSILSLTVGRFSISINEIIDLLTGHPVSKSITHVVINLRLPRMVGAILVGASLSIAGSIFQNIFQNPLVSPDLLGVSSGACVGAAVSIILGFESAAIASLSFVTGVICVCACIFISLISHRKNNFILVFSGIILSKFMDSVVGLLKFFADPESQLGDIVNWQLGTISKVTMDNVLLMGSLIIPCIVISFLFRWRVNIISTGEKEAKSLGINFAADRILLIVIATLLTAASVCFCGTISWVGLIIPHIAKWLVGNDNRKALPYSGLLGSIFLLLADIVARSATDYELPLGVITGFCGTPLFLVILIREGRRKKI